MSNISFEEAFSKLERIAERLEMGELTLEESLKLYEEGIKYSRICIKILEDAKRRIDVVKITENEGFTIEEIDPEEILKNENE